MVHSSSAMAMYRRPVPAWAKPTISMRRHRRTEQGTDGSLVIAVRQSILSWIITRDDPRVAAHQLCSGKWASSSRDLSFSSQDSCSSHPIRSWSRRAPVAASAGLAPAPKRTSAPERPSRHEKLLDVKFLFLAAFCLTGGVRLGIFMGTSEHFSLAPVHAHINLIGWASLALFGIVYKLYPEMARPAGRPHFILAAPSAWLFPLGIGLAAFHESRARDRRCLRLAGWRPPLPIQLAGLAFRIPEAARTPAAAAIDRSSKELPHAVSCLHRGRRSPPRRRRARRTDGRHAAPFPPVTRGAGSRLSGDERGTTIEFYPRGTEIHEVPGDHDAIGIRVAPRRYNATHFAMATKLGQDEVLAIAKREGWPAKYRKRGGIFGVIEIFVEGCQMIEVLTEEMQREYVAAVTIPNWMTMVKARNCPRPRNRPRISSGRCCPQSPHPLTNRRSRGVSRHVRPGSRPIARDPSWPAGDFAFAEPWVVDAGVSRSHQAAHPSRAVRAVGGGRRPDRSQRPQAGRRRRSGRRYPRSRRPARPQGARVQLPDLSPTCSNMSGTAPRSPPPARISSGRAA